MAGAVEILDERPFLRRVVHDGADAAEHRTEDLEAERGIALGGGHQHRVAGRGARAVKRGVVAQAEQDHEIGLGRDVPHALDERRTHRPLAVEPGQFVGHRVHLLEHERRAAREVARVALVRDGKALHRNAVDAGFACWILVLPGHVVARTRREHAYVGVGRQVLGDVPRVQLRSAADIGGVALHDDGELHRSVGSDAGVVESAGVSAG